MSSAKTKRRLAMLSSLVSILLTTVVLSMAQTSRVPNPSVMFLGQEPYQANGRSWIRYSYLIENFDAYPNAMFAAAPALPPCGSNTNASRTWVDIFDQSGRKLYGFCALGSNTGLGNLWFAMEEGVVPPSWIYIELNDRQTGTKYKSGLAETTQ